MKQSEFILCSAINYNGIIICGHRHGDCYDVLTSLVGNIETSKLPNRYNQGFLTSQNRYVDRKEAWIIAKANNQIAYGLNACDNDNKESSDWLGVIDDEPILISENLY